MSQPQVLGTDAYMVLVVTLILVQRIVLVDILNVRIGLIRGVIAFRLLVVVGRVALWHVDALVAFQDAGTAIVQVTATEVVVVIVCRVGIPGTSHTVVDADTVEESVISRIAALLFVVQTVESDILQGTRAAGGGEGIGLGGLYRNASPL